MIYLEGGSLYFLVGRLFTFYFFFIKLELRIAARVDEHMGKSGSFFTYCGDTKYVVTYSGFLLSRVLL